MLSTKQIQADIRALTSKAIAQLDEADWRMLAWKTAAVPGPIAASADPIADHVLEGKVRMWREALIKKLTRREALVKVAGSALVGDQSGRLVQLESELDELSALIIGAEEMPARSAARLPHIAKMQREQHDAFIRLNKVESAQGV